MEARQTNFQDFTSFPSCTWKRPYLKSFALYFVTLSPHPAVKTATSPRKPRMALYPQRLVQVAVLVLHQELQG